MSAGQFRKRITIQSPSTVRNAFGETAGSWTMFATTWASIDDMSGREYMAADAVQNAAQTTITIRYRDGIVPSMRVLHGSVIYNIEAVLGQDRRTLLLMCSSGVSNG